jgi:hypothetical protein
VAFLRGVLTWDTPVNSSSDVCPSGRVIVQDTDDITLHGAHGVDVIKGIFTKCLLDRAVGDLAKDDLKDVLLDLVALVSGKGRHPGSI